MSFTIKRLPFSRIVGPFGYASQNSLPSISIHTSSQGQKSIKSWYQGLWTPRKTEPPYSHITQIGDPILRQKSSPVPLDSIKSKEFNRFLDHLVDVLRGYKCVGLAASQIGIPLKVIVMEFHDGLRDKFSSDVYKTCEMEILPLTILINPQITVTDYNKKTFVESCASVRGYSAEVARYEAITLTGLNRNGEQQQLHLKGWNARIAQHEMDHLNGIIYTDLMNRQSFTCTCWHIVNVKEGRVNIPFGPK